MRRRSPLRGCSGFDSVHAQMRRRSPVRGCSGFDAFPLKDLKTLSFGLLAADFAPNSLGNIGIDLGMWTLPIRHHNRRSRNAGFADLNIQRHFAQEIRPQLCRCLPCATMAKQVLAVATFGANVLAHVLNDTQHRHVNLVEHV
jgi:hypothetical protein